MTARRSAFWLIAIGYSTLMVMGALLASAVLARMCGRAEIPVFFAVLSVLVVAVAFTGGRLQDALLDMWDRHFDEHGRSWAVLEAERILHTMGE